MPDDYDSPWKEAIERHFADFLAFYFPTAHAQIDWSHSPVFLDQELRAAVHDAELGKRFVDKLVRVTRVGGREDWLYIHLEIQGSAQDAFAERMYIYNYRLYDRYRQPVASLAVLADDRLNWRPESFNYDMLGCQVSIRFPVAKLMDWSGSESRLEDSDNPFALVTLAHLETRRTRNDMAARKAMKWTLLRNLCRRTWERQKVIDLVNVIDWMMWLPKDLSLEIRQDLHTLETEAGMRYVNTFEQFAKEEGMEEGLRSGIRQGQARLLARQISQRFGEVPPWVQTSLENAPVEMLERWSDQILSADSIETVFGASRS